MNLLCKFVPHLALTDKDTECMGVGKHQGDAFDCVKQLVTESYAITMRGLPAKIQCDSRARHADLETTATNGHPIYEVFMSRMLSATERWYTQIEKERLAIVFACKRFNQYIFQFW